MGIIAGVALVAAAFLFWVPRSHPPTVPGPSATSSVPHLVPGPAPVPAAKELPVAEQVDNVMTVWRAAITNRNSEDVLACDRIFRDEPDKYRAALVESARKDPDERIRAFSTRVLGKLKDARLTPLFRELLTDASPHVRKNGAWALGVLGARESRPDLEALKRNDVAPKVRAAAAVALDQTGRSSQR